nr:hypothetical protein [Paenibacillus sp. IHB B 3084]
MESTPSLTDWQPGMHKLSSLQAVARGLQRNANGNVC